MGAYLSEPITEKVSSDEVGKNVAFGASSMQGWRVNQEDAHNCCIEFDENVSLFAVYDGHGGHEVATYCARNLPEFIKQTDAYKKGDIRQALIDAFLGFDATLAKPEIVNILKEIAGTAVADGEKEDPEESDEEENVSNLCMEAAMPLEQVMAKYQSCTDSTIPVVKSLKGEKFGERACFSSPYLRRRGRDKASCSSSDAGCSSSSTSWNTNEADVSSSSQPCGSSTSSSSTSAVVEVKQTETPGSSEAEQVLDSTTSNGDVAHTSPPVGSTADAEPTKSADMPDSSEDINGKVSTGKSIPAEPNVTDMEVNGGDSKGDFRDADSSKGGGDNVSSSSCSLLENGEAGQQERISSSGRRRIQLIDPYHSLLNKKEEEESDEDSDDENDETFDAAPESDGDTEDVDEEDDESDDDDEEEVDNDENDLTMDMTEEPGSDSGCTAVVAILQGNELYVANAGDSRCVLCRDGQALELSLDHKPEDQPEMQRIVKAGGKVTADGRVNGGLNLSRALGDHAYKQNIELPAQEQMISALPDVRHTTIDPEKDEFMILACDGIWNFMSSQDVIQFVRTRLLQGYKNISQICEELFDHCLAPDTLGDGTGCDNMTAVIVQFKSSQANAPSETSETKKRPVSPSLSKDDADAAAEDVITSDCKRSKTEESV